MRSFWSGSSRHGGGDGGGDDDIVLLSLLVVVNSMKEVVLKACLYSSLMFNLRDKAFIIALFLSDDDLSVTKS